MLRSSGQSPKRKTAVESDCVDESDTLFRESDFLLGRCLRGGFLAGRPLGGYASQAGAADTGTVLLGTTTSLEWCFFFGQPLRAWNGVSWHHRKPGNGVSWQL